MRIVLLLIALALVWLDCEAQHQPLYQCSFEPGWSNLESNQVWQGRTGQPELSAGLLGQALRLDGYAAAVHSRLKRAIASPFTVSAWVALETYPTHPAGCFSLESDPGDTSSYLTVGITNFGQPFIGTPLGRLVADGVMPKFRWQHLALIVDVDSAKLLWNGQFVAAIAMAQSAAYTHIYLGRDASASFVHIFPTMHINGLLDEVTIWDGAIPTNELPKWIPMDNIGMAADLCIPPQRFAHDHTRPQYHLLPLANWTNETHGLLYHNGLYHIFNQKNGTNVFLGNINWGHFSSPDLIHWTEHRPVLTPEPGYDQMGIWSGHVVTDQEGSPALFYTGSDGSVFSICRASPQDSLLLTWEKSHANPLIKGNPPQYHRADMRDPYVWKEDSTWYMVVGYGILEDSTEQGALLLYRSHDLTAWEYRGIFFHHKPWDETPGVFWEMPVFWKMGDKYLLLVNPIPYQHKPARAIYWVGEFKQERFIPDHEQPRQLEIINRLLSPSVAQDEEGRTTAIAIIPDLIPAEMQYQRGWTHLYSIPRLWELKDKVLHQSPHPALKKLRGTPRHQSNLYLKEGDTLLLAKGQHLELLLQLDISQTSSFNLIVGKNAHNGEATPLHFDLAKASLRIDHNNSSLDPGFEKRVEQGFFHHRPQEPLLLHLFVDGSVLEGFLNKQEAFTTRFFTTDTASDNIVLVVQKGSLIVSDMTVWPITPARVSCGF
jgi:beta-fructofuranosidase